MFSQPAISICIPAYKNTSFLERLLNSIFIQQFKDYEVIITDDSPDQTVKDFISTYANLKEIKYYRNISPLGTPENWNEALRKASGKWIKIMHDDDWFHNSESLGRFYELATRSEDISFVFSGSIMVDNHRRVGRQQLSSFQQKLLRKDARNLFAKNVIGPPSVVMHRNDGITWYDARMKWLVDIDFYIRYLQNNPTFNFTAQPLVNVGFSEVQVTKAVFYDRQVVIPENLLLLSKLDNAILTRLWNYDFCWRLMRNYGIRDAAELLALNHPEASKDIPAVLLHIIRGQKRIPPFLLKMGLFSKSFMLLNYLTFILNYKTGKKD